MTADEAQSAAVNAAARIGGEWNDPRNIGPRKVDLETFRRTWARCFNCSRMVRLDGDRCSNCRSRL